MDFTVFLIIKNRRIKFFYACFSNCYTLRPIDEKFITAIKNEIVDNFFAFEKLKTNFFSYFSNKMLLALFPNNYYIYKYIYIEVNNYLFYI